MCLSVAVAVCITSIGYVGRDGALRVLLAPGSAIAALVPDNGRDNSLEVWISVYGQLFAWALTAELVRGLVSQIRRREANRAAHA